MPNDASQRIRQAALDLMARRGVSGTTTQDIAERARCSQAAIYKHWEGKEILARDLFDAGYTRLLAGMEEGAAGTRDSAERILGLLLGLLAFARAEPAQFAYLFQVFHSDYVDWLVPHARRPRDLVLREVEAGQRSGAIPAGRPATKTAMLLGMAIRLAFLERQNLVDGSASDVDQALAEAALAVLES